MLRCAGRVTPGRSGASADSDRHAGHGRDLEDRGSCPPPGQKPLIFPKDDLTTSCYLNDFFFYVFSKFSEWQNMKSMTVSSLACVSALTRSTWASH